MAEKATRYPDGAGRTTLLRYASGDENIWMMLGVDRSLRRISTLEAAMWLEAADYHHELILHKDLRPHIAKVAGPYLAAVEDPAGDRASWCIRGLDKPWLDHDEFEATPREWIIALESTDPPRREAVWEIERGIDGSLQQLVNSLLFWGLYDGLLWAHHNVRGYKIGSRLLDALARLTPVAALRWAADDLTLHRLSYCVQRAPDAAVEYVPHLLSNGRAMKLIRLANPYAACAARISTTKAKGEKV